MVALIQRFYRVQAGRILIDGQDIELATEDSLRQVIAVVRRIRRCSIAR